MKKHDLSVFEIEKEGYRLKLEKRPSVQPSTVVPPAVPAQPKAGSTTPEPAPPAAKAIETVPLKEIVSPMVGTFYRSRSEEHTSELQSQSNLVCRLLLEKKKHPQ